MTQDTALGSWTGSGCRDEAVSRQNHPEGLCAGKKLTCWILGEGTLAIRCAELLLHQGHVIYGVVSPDTSLQRWTQANKISTFPADVDLLSVMGSRPFDYLFSIVNFRILPEAVLRLPRKGAINFHDAPLPRYAGSHATSWALMNREPTHGITWHRMSQRVDSGELLKQRRIEVEPNETAFTLNTRCFESGALAFAELLEELANDRLHPQSQKPAERTFFSRWKRPEAAGILDWTGTAQELDAMVRGLNFGSYLNPLGRPKLYAEDELLIVPELTILPSKTEASPGTILKAEESGFTIATASEDVVIPQLMTLPGRPLSRAEAALKHGLKAGRRLKTLDPEASGQLTRAYEALSRHEEFWVKRLSTLQPIDLPWKRVGKSRTSPEGLEASPSERQGNGSSPLADAESFAGYRQFDLPIPEEALLTPGEQGVEGLKHRADFLLAAFGLFLARLSGPDTFDLGVAEPGLWDPDNPACKLFAPHVPLRLGLDHQQKVAQALGIVRTELELVRSHKTYARDVPTRHPSLQGSGGEPANLELPVIVQLALTPKAVRQMEGVELMLVIPQDGSACCFIYDPRVFAVEGVAALARRFATFLRSLAANEDQRLKDVPLLTGLERQQVLEEWNETKADFPAQVCVHQLVELQAGKTPEAVAAVFQEEEITYCELNRRANQVAHYLRRSNAGPEVLVGICAEVGLEMLIALLGILKAGAAYVPLDPSYPKERLSLMLEDARMPILLTQEKLVGLMDGSGFQPAVICLDRQRKEISSESEENPVTNVVPENLAYVIYTSGSTGKPKGVMVTHRNIVNFFAGMDERIGAEPGVWLAVTSISFDISVLELFWTLARGFKVVLHRNEQRAGGSPSAKRSGSGRKLDFSLFYFASDEANAQGEKYRLLLQGAKFADEHGFTAIWTPERHFHAFGGLYPNPSVTSAAVATITKRLKIRAGSVVLPLHNPIRVAEEWSVVDNLSNGRVGISFASGWQMNDFVLAPENYAERKDLMLLQIEVVRKLWRGETLSFRGPNGQETPVKILPRPIQRDLPIWITAAGNPDSFKLAGQIGANLLTHLLGQSAAELAEKIALYRQTRKEHGHAGDGHVTLMLHTFVGEDLRRVRETVRQPLTAYLRSSMDLIKNSPWLFPTFRKGPQLAPGASVPRLTEEEMNLMSAHAFERYFETSGLFGPPALCLQMLEQWRDAGVDEIACLIDFGIDADSTLASLRHLVEVKNQKRTPNLQTEADYSVASQIVRHRVTHLQCTPSLAGILARDPKALEALRSIRKLMLGGEALPASLLQQLALPGQMLNMYGPTETTIWSTTHAVVSMESAPPIGRPIANTEVYILDSHLQPTPPGVPGELLIGGAGVVRGYLNRPELTAEKFIEHPFKQGSGMRLYRTGDLATYRPDGTIEYLGRIDHQVKLRGFRIELGEIEAVLRKHPEVEDAVVTVRGFSPGDQRLVAYIVPNEAGRHRDMDLRDFLKGKLPDFMVPSAIIALQALPLTPNGKIDRKALPAPAKQSRSAGKFVAPGSPLEKAIAKAWCEVLGLQQVGIDDNFFEGGGHSLLAAQLVSRFRDASGLELPLRLVFEKPTVRAQARALAAEPQGVVTGKSGNQPIQRRQNTEEWPLSSAQRRIWFLDQLEPGNHYNDHFNLRLSGPLNVAALEKSIQEIERRHEVLRASFDRIEERPVQRVRPGSDFSLPVLDLRMQAEASRETELRRLSIDENRLPFNLETGPLFRGKLVRLTEEEHVLVLTFHHIVIDGWSRGIFLQELKALYEAHVSSKPAPLSAPPIQYADFAAWQREWLQGKSVEAHLNYWRQQLQGIPDLLELPVDRPRPAVQSYRGARAVVRLERSTVDHLKALGQQEGCTLFMTLAAAFQTFLYCHTGYEDIVVGTPVANRNRAEIEKLIGCFLNTIVLRTAFSGEPTFRELLGRVREVALGAYAHQQLPFERLVEELRPVRDLSYSPVFQVLFILQNATMPVSQLGPLRICPYEIDGGVAKLDLTLSLEETEGELTGWFEYSTDLFDQNTILRLVGQFRALIEEVIASPDQKLLPRQRPNQTKEQCISLSQPVLEGNAVRLQTRNRRKTDAALKSNRKVPANSTEKALAQIWADVLGVEQVGMEDDFFDSGGHSLLATQVVARIRKTFQVDLPVRALFEGPTIAALSNVIEEKLRSEIHELSEEETHRMLSGA